MKIKVVLFLAVMLFVFPGFTKAETNKSAAFFCAQWNTHCKNVEKFLKGGGYYEKYNIIYFNFDKLENITLLEKIMSAKNEEKAAIPAMVIDSEVLIGDEAIMTGFDKKMEKSENTTVDFISNFGYIVMENDKEARNASAEEMLSAESVKVGVTEENEEEKGIPFALLFFTAISDAINPCAFAILTLLVGTILKTRGRERALISGIVFSAAIFVSYFLMGLGLYKALTIFEVPKYMSFCIGVFAIILGIANLKDAFWYGKFFTMEMPVSWRPKAQTIIRHAESYKGVFLAGLIMSLFLIPCAGGPYVIIIGLLAAKAKVSSTLPVLLAYNLIFIVPMIATAFALYFLKLHREVDEGGINKKTKRFLHAVIAIILLFVGFYLIK